MPGNNKIFAKANNDTKRSNCITVRWIEIDEPINLPNWHLMYSVLSWLNKKCQRVTDLPPRQALLLVQ